MTLVLAGTSLAACGDSTPAKKSPAPTETLYHHVGPTGPLPHVKHLRPAT